MATITFDGVTKLIEIGADGAPGSVTVVSYTQIYSRWKDWVCDDVGAQYDEAFSLSVGGNDLGDGISLDGYFFVRNDLGWRIIPEDQDGTWVFDGNGFGFNPSLAVYLGRPGRTIGIRERQSSRSQVVQADASLLEASAAFNGEVWLDPASGNSGTVFPVGTSVQPVNNLNDALAVAGTYGLRGIHLLGNLTLTQDLIGFEVLGATTNVTVDLGGRKVTGTAFRVVNVTGSADPNTGDFVLRNAKANNLLNFRGLIVGTGLTGTLAMSGDALIAQSWSGGGAVALIADYVGTKTHDVQFRQFTGAIDVMNMIAGSEMTADLMPGWLVIDASSTGGVLKLRGIGEPLVDNSGLVTVDSDGFNPGGAATIDYEQIRDDIVPHIWAARRPDDSN